MKKQKKKKKKEEKQKGTTSFDVLISNFECRSTIICILHNFTYEIRKTTKFNSFFFVYIYI